MGVKVLLSNIFGNVDNASCVHLNACISSRFFSSRCILFLSKFFACLSLFLSSFLHFISALINFMRCPIKSSTLGDELSISSYSFFTILVSLCLYCFFSTCTCKIRVLSANTLFLFRIKALLWLILKPCLKCFLLQVSQVDSMKHKICHHQDQHRRIQSFPTVYPLAYPQTCPAPRKVQWSWDSRCLYKEK